MIYLCLLLLLGSFLIIYGYWHFAYGEANWKMGWVLVGYIIDVVALILMLNKL